MPEAYRAILVMGVCGVGKSTVAEALTDRLGGTFVEADQYHPPENVAAMSAGRPLTDAMRWGWLERLAEAAAGVRRPPAVIACSALKRMYRDRLRARLGAVAVVHLSGARDLLAARMAARPGHFMPASLLESQFADLEPPSADEAALTIDVTGDRDAVVAAAADWLLARQQQGLSGEGDKA